jgi:ribose 5-phosphate isomerase B
MDKTKKNLKVIIGSDHAGFEAKAALAAHLAGQGWKVTDSGTYSSASCDYPAEAHKLCVRIQSGEFALGILLCGTGVGISIAANKHAGIRAALCSDPVTAELARQHNDANVLCMGARILPEEKLFEIADRFLSTDALDEERHRRRQRMLTDLENSSFAVPGPSGAAEGK